MDDFLRSLMNKQVEGIIFEAFLAGVRWADEHPQDRKDEWGDENAVCAYADRMMRK